MAIARSLKRKIRVLVADREAIFRLGLKKLFAVEDDLRVVGEAEDAGDVVARAKTVQPELVFIQEEVLTAAVGNLISAVLKVARQCRVVATASSISDESLMRHVQNGAAGVILKTVDSQLFVKCARCVTRGGTWVPKKQVSKIAKPLEAGPDTPSRPVDTLTRRERTVISYLMLGWHNREIGTQFSISEQTVKNHLRNIYDKVGVSDRLELVLYAIHHRMELPPSDASVPPS